MPTHWESSSEPIPGYRLIERLGRGGFGEVWKAEAPGGLTKAIKFVFGTIESEASGDRNHADQELKALSRVRGIRHPFILSMERFDIIEGQLVIVMELADRSLDDRLRECQRQGLPGLPRAELLKYLSEAAEALDLMNSEHDLQHLDIKPSNLFLVGTHVKVADFGLVKDMEGRTAQVTGGVTPVYAAPETFDGWVSRNTDQYSLAIVYQELLTGHRPFQGPSARQFMMQHLTSPPDLASLPECDRLIVQKALAKDPDARFPTCTSLIEALAGAGMGSSAALNVPLAPPPGLEGALAGPTPVAAEEFSTQLSKRDEASLSGASPRPSARAGTVRDPTLLEPTPDGTVCPTLVIGLGKTGIRCVERVHDKLSARFGDSASWPPMRLVTFDSDPNVLRELEQTERVSRRSVDYFVPCKVRKPTQYFQKWEGLKHLSSWLDPNYLFHITAAGTTNGHRPLGRLALIDNYRKVVARLRQELDELLSPARIESSLNATGLRLRSKYPRVLILANMGGGTGSGMFIDMGYIVRRLLLESGAAKPDIQGMLIAAMGPPSRDDDLRRINHYALAQDLLNLMQPDAEFVVEYETDGDRDRFTSPPVESAYFFDAFAQHMPEPKDEVVLDSIAELIFHGTMDSLGRHVDNAALSWPRFRAPGWFSLVYPRRALLRQSAGRLCHAMVQEWIQPLTGKKRDDLVRAAEASIASAGFTTSTIANQILEECNRHLPEPVHVLVAKRLAKLEEQIAKRDPAGQDELRLAAVDDIKQILGLDPYEEEGAADAVPLLDTVIVKASNAVASALLAPLARSLAQTLDEPGPRVERARRTIEGFSQYLIRMVDQQQEHARTAQQAVHRRARELRDRPAVGHAAAAMLRGEGGGGILSLLERYAEEKIECRLREQVAQVFLVLRGKLSDKARELVSIRQELDRLLDQLRAAREQVEDVGGYSAQTLFPGGLLMLSDAVQQVCEHFEGRRLGAMEMRIQQNTLVSLGGLWSACTSGDDMTSGIANAMISQAMSWIQDNLPPADVADAFFARHQTDETGRINELRAFFEWACPSMIGRPARTGGQDQIPIAESFFLTVPSSDSGANFANSLEQVAAGVAPVLITGSEQCVLCRVQTHPSLARLLPLWLLEARKLYDAACQSRLTPEIFPEMAKK